MADTAEYDDAIDLADDVDEPVDDNAPAQDLPVDEPVDLDLPVPVDDLPTAAGRSPVGSFLIGFLIIIGASIMNAAGLNLTQYDHLRNQGRPKGSRRPDYLRPLWCAGMGLYILSQLLGSTLALEYMRAEWVAPLGSSSLIFNALFASLLLGTPITRRDIQGTLLIVLGVVGIVAFGSVNSGLSDALDLDILKTLWARAGWLVWFFILLIGTTTSYLTVIELENIVRDREDEEAVPPSYSRAPPTESRFRRALRMWSDLRVRLRLTLERWTDGMEERKLKKGVGMAWAVEGGLLASECLILAKATVKLIATQLSHSSSSNQFLHPLFIITVILLAITAVSQIICLNKGLSMFDTTIVVPIFYGVYTSVGFVNTLIFMDQLGAFKAWVLWCISLSILILLAGVFLLSSKKPEPATGAAAGPGGPKPAASPSTTRLRLHREDADIELGLGTSRGAGGVGTPGHEEEVMWEIGEASDDDDDDAVQAKRAPRGDGRGEREPLRREEREEEAEDELQAAESSASERPRAARRMTATSDSLKRD